MCFHYSARTVWIYGRWRRISICWCLRFSALDHQHHLRQSALQKKSSRKNWKPEKCSVKCGDYVFCCSIFFSTKNAEKFDAMRNSVTAKCLGSTRDFARFRIPPFPIHTLGVTAATIVEYNRHSRKFTTGEEKKIPCKIQNHKFQIFASFTPPMFLLYVAKLDAT